MARSPRDRRLLADAEAVSQLVRDSSILLADAKGNPPTRYRFRFQGRGMAVNREGLVVPQDFHEVEVELGAAYPRLMPTLHWKTPIFHPNISANGVVCLGGYGTHWVPSLTLAEMCNMIWDMIRMKNFDINSPYNRDAAIWIRDQTAVRFPLDGRPLRDRVLGAERGLPELSTNSRLDAKAPEQEIEIVEDGIEIVFTGERNSDASDLLFIDS